LVYRDTTCGLRHPRRQLRRMARRMAQQTRLMWSHRPGNLCRQSSACSTR